MVQNHFRSYTADPARFSEAAPEWWWAVVKLKTGAVVGLCSLIEKEIAGQPEIELGYYLLPAYWGHGYATEAAVVVVDHARSHLGARSLVAVIDPENTASIRVARRLGMAFEREELRSDGVTRHVYRLQ